MAKGGALNGKLVVLMGGSGFIGQYVAQTLLERGARVRIASRNPERAFKLKPLANLGQIQLARCEASDRRNVERCMAGADAVINLVGSFEGDLYRLMGEAPGWMAEAARANGAQAFVHMSAITGPTAPEHPIAYSEAKQMGEERVRAAFAGASILRPSILFGKDDKFLNLFAGPVSALPIIPVFGPEAQLQPVYVDDVAEAAVRALEKPGAHGAKVYELAGPEVLTMMEINRRIAAAQARARSFLPVPDPVSALFAALPGTPLSSDQWALLKAGNIASRALPGLDKLGITASPLGLFLDKWMVRYRKHGRFTDRLSA